MNNKKADKDILRIFTIESLMNGCGALWGKITKGKAN
jgi:hypothetical protein